MSPVRFRPELRLPWQAITAFVAVLYVLRSALRDWDFRPDAIDIVIFGALAVILLLRPLIARLARPDDEDD